MNAHADQLTEDDQNDLTAVSPQIKAQILAEALPTSAISTARPSSSNTAAMR
jgi:hypothetical protein